jgi:hypothetical protein
LVTLQVGSLELRPVMVIILQMQPIGPQIMGPSPGFNAPAPC